MLHLQLLCKTLRNPPRSALAIRLLGKPSLRTLSQTAAPPLPLVRYLAESCFLSPEAALSVAKKLKRKLPRNSDSVLAFLKDHGFSRTHISKLVPKLPGILCFRVDSNLRPKMEFFREIGLSASDVASFLSLQPDILSCNLEKKIKPFFDLVHGISGTHGTMLKALQQPDRFFRCSLEKVFVPNVTLLQSCKVPNSLISRLFMTHPRSLLSNPDMFRKNVNFVMEMGFDPSTHLFMEAVRASGTLSRATWERKLQTYRSLGWSDETVLLAFRRHPGVLTISEEKIKKGVAFFTEELGWGPSLISSYPTVLSFSLEKRIVPRHRVLQVLKSMGLVKKNLNPVKSFFMKEKKFLENFVLPHPEMVPQLTKVYRGEVAIAMSGIEEGEAIEVQ